MSDTKAILAICRELLYTLTHQELQLFGVIYGQHPQTDTIHGWASHGNGYGSIFHGIPQMKAQDLNFTLTAVLSESDPDEKSFSIHSDAFGDADNTAENGALFGTEFVITNALGSGQRVTLPISEGSVNLIDDEIVWKTADGAPDWLTTIDTGGGVMVAFNDAVGRKAIDTIEDCRKALLNRMEITNSELRIYEDNGTSVFKRFTPNSNAQAPDFSGGRTPA